MRVRKGLATLALAAVAACGSTDPGANFSGMALIDLGPQAYLNSFEGGLYPGGVNTMPAAHASAGAAHARNIQPLNGSGAPSASGKYVLLSIGMSNATQEWCALQGNSCNPWTFTGQAEADAAVNHGTMVIANGAEGGQDGATWDSPSDANYNRVRDDVLAPMGLTEQQVQAVWVKEATSGPVSSLPSQQADAYLFEATLGKIVRALKTRYPNLQVVFLSSRIYGGYGVHSVNPEPFAYETGFSVKWIIQAQIDQMNNGGTVVDTRAGNLNYNTVAPWIAWGPYLWANGDQPRSDGLRWLRSDFQGDGTHPSTAGETKVGGMLLTFFKSNPQASCWFLAGATCP